MILEGLAKQILVRMPGGLTQIEQARYIYIELGKLLSFDETYIICNTKSKEKMYHNAMKKPIDWAKLKQGQKEVCVSIARMYMELLREIGIDASITREEGQDPKLDHISNLIFIDKKVYRADLQEDLQWIQTNSQTRSFASDADFQETKILPEELEVIDRKIGYMREETDYKNTYLDELKERISCYESVTEKVATIIQAVKEYKDMSKMETVEITMYYQWAFRHCLTNEEFRKIKLTKLIRQKEGTEGGKDYITCLSVEKKGLLYDRYLYSQIQHGYLPVEEEILRKLMQQGLQPLPKDYVPYMKGQKRVAKREIEDSRINM